MLLCKKNHKTTVIQFYIFYGSGIENDIETESMKPKSPDTYLCTYKNLVAVKMALQISDRRKDQSTLPHTRTKRNSRRIKTLNIYIKTLKTVEDILVVFEVRRPSQTRIKTRWRFSEEHFQGSEITLFYTIMVDTCHFTFVQIVDCTTSRVKLDANRGLWVIMMSIHCQL